MNIHKFLNLTNKYFPRKHFQKYWLVLMIFLGISLRFLVSTRGFNYDFESFLIVADIIGKNNNVYLLTDRYNYGPIWFQILRTFYHLSTKDLQIFRYMIILLLSFADLGIFVILLRKFGRIAAYFFFFNPVSIIITGYHNQIDNLAILLGMISVIILDNNTYKNINLRDIVGLIFLGLSLTTKHLLFVFPFWLAIKQEFYYKKILYFLIPYIIFLLNFLPYWNEGNQGIIQNVFLYNSWNNGYFYKFFIPEIIRLFFSSRAIWMSLLFFFAFYFKKENYFNSLLLYSCVLVFASPAITNQYLAIVIPFLAVNYKSPTSMIYSLIGMWFLAIDSNGLQFNQPKIFLDIGRDAYYFVLIILLLLNFINFVWKEDLKKRILILRKLFS